MNPPLKINARKLVGPGFLLAKFIDADVWFLIKDMDDQVHTAVWWPVLHSIRSAARTFINEIPED